MENPFEKQNQEIFEILEKAEREKEEKISAIPKSSQGFPLLKTEQVERILYGTLEESKGILLMGRTGCGKTTIFENFIKSLDGKIPVPKIPIYITAKDIVSNFEKYGDKYFGMQETHSSLYYGLVGRRPIYIDDIGSEQSLSYGRGAIIGRVITQIIENKGKLYCSTNLNLDQLKECYGQRVSKIMQHCSIFVLDNPDFRVEIQKEMSTTLIAKYL